MSRVASATYIPFWLASNVSWSGRKLDSLRADLYISNIGRMTRASCHTGQTCFSRRCQRTLRPCSAEECKFTLVRLADLDGQVPFELHFGLSLWALNFGVYLGPSSGHGRLSLWCSRIAEARAPARLLVPRRRHKATRRAPRLHAIAHLTTISSSCFACFATWKEMP